MGMSLAAMFHEEETEEGRVRKAFDKFDRDGSGHIDKTGEGGRE
jgi:Ca2+-binding EF-hand superfamily protein